MPIQQTNRVCKNCGHAFDCLEKIINDSRVCCSHPTRNNVCTCGDCSGGCKTTAKTAYFMY